MPEAAADELLEAFLAHCAKERDLSPNTLKAYRGDLTALAAWLGATRGVAGWQWEALGRRDLREYQAHQLAAGAARRTLARRLSAIRAFYKWLHQEEVVDANPGRALRAPRPRMGQPLPGSCAAPVKCDERCEPANGAAGAMSLTG